jgi:hypothetical protein
MASNTRNVRIPSAFSGPNDQRRIPMLFQILSPDYATLLLPEAMLLHVNPTTLSLSYAKVKDAFQTLGGWHEQHFGDQLTDVSCDVTSGAFINVDTGLAVASRRETIAYEKFYQLVDLFHNNGLVYDSDGTVQYRGRIRLTFEGGVYDGSFRSLTINESASNPFQLTCDFAFRVEKEAMSVLV